MIVDITKQIKGFIIKVTIDNKQVLNKFVNDGGELIGWQEFKGLETRQVTELAIKITEAFNNIGCLMVCKYDLDGIYINRD